MVRKMKDSGIAWIGEIPADWNIQRNKLCFNCSKAIVGEKSSETQLLSLTTKGIKLKKPEDSTGKVPESYDTYQTVVPDDIVMCLFDLDVSAVFAGRSPYAGMISPAYKVLKCKNRIIPSFADYWFSFVFDGRKFKHYAKNLRYTLNYDEFAVLPIAVPAVIEQTRIAAFLDAECEKIDAVIEQTRASIEEYKKLKQSVITEAVTKGIRKNRPMKDSGIEWIGDVPLEWKMTKIKYISSDVGDGLHAAPEFKDNGLYYFINGNNLGNKQIQIKDNTNSVSQEEYSKYKQPTQSSNTILIALNGTYGLVSFYNGERIMLGKSAGYINLYPTINRNFIRYALMADCSKRQLDDSLAGTTIANISLKTIKNILITRPCEDEQREISLYLDCKCTEFDKFITEKTRLIAELENYKKSLIYEYVTGKKEVV